MSHSIGQHSEIPTSARILSEEELTFLDDVPDVQVDEFIKFVAEDNDETNVVKWYFSNPYRVMGFMKARYDNVVDYFRYLRNLTP